MKLLKKRILRDFCLCIAGFLLLCTGLTGCADNREAELFAEEETEPEAQSLSVTPLQEPEEIYVDVCGAVASPGVYALKEGSRVFQAIEAAGGYLPEAAQAKVNRAQGLTDGQQVYIPTQQESEQQDTVNGNSEQGQTQPDSGKVNLNTADEAALTTLPGIGASKARAVIAYREANGPFQAVEDIMKVEGIKEGTFAKIKDDIVVG